MQLSPAERQALETSKKTLFERHSREASRRQELEAFNERRHLAAREFKQKLFDQALHAAKVDQEALTKRQQRDNNSGKEFLQKQQQTALEHANEINQRNAAAISERISLWRRINNEDRMASQSIIVATLESAAEIVIFGPGNTSIAPDENLAFTKASIDSSGFLGGPLKGDLVYVDWFFAWTPPRAGLLNVTSFLSLNGVSSLWTNADCNGGDASSTIDAFVTLRQGNVSDSFPGNRLFDRYIASPWGDSVGVADFFALDETDVVGVGRPTQFPVAAQIPVSITVEASLYVLVRNAQAELDFMSGDFRLNVPYVFLTLG